MLDFSKLDGLVPAIVQDYQTGEVLMLGFMNDEAWDRTQSTGRAYFYSRTRQKLWCKGETSGHIQKVKAIYVDCDQDTVLLKVEQVGGAACHTGYRSCFHKLVEGQGYRLVGTKVFDPEEVYGRE